LKRVVEAEWIGEAPDRQRYRLKVRELAATLKTTPNGMSHALARGVRRKADDERFRVDLGKLDRVIATGSKKA
jgi:hypothetical protein